MSSSEMEISLLDFCPCLRPNDIDSVLDPFVSSFLGCSSSAVDIALSLQRMSRIVVKVDWAFPERKVRNVEWIDSNFVVLVAVLLNNAKSCLRSFMRPYGCARLDFASWNAGDLPGPVPPINIGWLQELSSHEGQYRRRIAARPRTFTDSSCISSVIL